jgi:hypothetical protein
LLQVPLAERVEQRARARRPGYRSALARCLTGRCVCLSNRKLAPREIAEARMRAHLVVVPPPRLDDHLRPDTRTKQRNHSRLRHSSRNLPSNLSVTPFCRGFARLDQRGADALRDDPRQQGFRHELWSVVAAQEARRATRTHQARQYLDDARRAGTLTNFLPRLPSSPRSRGRVQRPAS